MATKSPILQHDGTPFPKKPPEGPRRAGPTLGGVRSPISGHPADGLTPVRLAAIHRAAASGDPLAYFELAEDMEERDAHYAAVLGTRKRQVAQIPITVEPAGDDDAAIRHADFVRDWLALGILQGALYDMFDAVGKGLSILEIEWDSRPGYVAPRALHWCDPRFFDLDDVTLDEPRLLDGASREALEPWRYVVHRHKSKSGLTIRSGLARAASWMWMYKAFTLRDWAIFVQNYGLPIRVGKYHSGATDEDKDVLWNAVSQIGGDLAAIIDEAMKIELTELKSTVDSSTLFGGRADWCDRQISKLVLGQTATTDAIAGGHAIGKEHRLVQEDLERFDAQLGSTTVTRQIVQPAVAFTFGPQARYPVLRIGRPDETPIEVIITAVEKLGPLGLEVEESQILDRLGLTEKAEAREDGKPVRVVGGRASTSVVVPPTPETKPDPEAPEPTPEPDRHARGRLLAGMIELHSASPDHVALLTERLARDAAGIVAGLTDKVRVVFDQAEDMADLLDRLDRLQLGGADLREAMARAMALAHLVGRAAVMDELDG